MDKHSGRDNINSRAKDLERTNTVVEITLTAELKIEKGQTQWSR
jgi:hypothetical protein